MRATSVLPPMLFGLLAGAMGVRVLGDFDLTAGDYLSALCTVTVGWVIQHALVKRQVLDQIPLEHLGALCARIDDLINQCLDVPGTADAVNRERVRRVEVLTIVVYTMKRLADSHELDLGAGRMVERLWTFKAALTLDREPNLDEATSAGFQLRAVCMELQVQISESILNGNRGMFQ